MPKLYILCGYPFAGKSTIARELVSRLHLTRIALDDINAERGIGVDLRQSIPADEWEVTYDIYRNRIIANLRAGKSVITDTVAHKKENRDSLSQLAIDNHAEPIILYVATPLEVVEARWQANRQTHQRADVRDDSFYDVVEQFEEPTSDENPVTITPAMSTEDVLQIISRQQ